MEFLTDEELDAIADSAEERGFEYTHGHADLDRLIAQAKAANQLIARNQTLADLLHEESASNDNRALKIDQLRSELAVAAEAKIEKVRELCEKTDRATVKFGECAQPSVLVKDVYKILNSEGT